MWLGTDIRPVFLGAYAYCWCEYLLPGLRVMAERESRDI